MKVRTSQQMSETVYYEGNDSDAARQAFVKALRDVEARGYREVGVHNGSRCTQVLMSNGSQHLYVFLHK